MDEEVSWNATDTIRDAIVARFTGSGFGTILTAVNTSESTSAPQIASDENMTSGLAIYTLPQTTYVFPCVEVTPPEGTLLSHTRSSTTSEVSVWVYLSFRGSAKELDAWSPVYLTALVRTFLADTSASGYVWSPAEFSASPIGSTTEGTYVQAVGVRVVAQIAETI